MATRADNVWTCMCCECIYLPVVGPTASVGSEMLWAYVESTGFGPEEADCRPWIVYSYDSNSWDEQVDVQVVNLDPSEVLEISHKSLGEVIPERYEPCRLASVEFDLMLNLEMSDILLDAEGFKEGVLQDLAEAIRGRRDKMRVLGLEAGSVIVQVAFDHGVGGDMRGVLDVLRELERQVGDPLSRLRHGTYTCSAKHMRMRESRLSHLEPQSRCTRQLSASQRKQHDAIVSEIAKKPKTPRAPATPPELTESLGAIDLDGDGKIDGYEFNLHLESNKSLRLGASMVRIDGVVLYNGGSAQPYRGINGDYERSNETCNRRAVYTKVGRAAACMWWANNDGMISWCVGPRNMVGKEGMWAFVESMGVGPEEAGSRAWNVFNYNCASWEEQTGVEVVSLDRPDTISDEFDPLLEQGEFADFDTMIVEGENEHDDFDAAIEQAEAHRANAMNRSRPNTGSVRSPSGKARPMTGRSSRSSPAGGTGPMTGNSLRPSTSSRRQSMSGTRSRPLTPLERRVEDELVQQVRSRPQTPRPPSVPAQSDNKHKVIRGNTPPTGGKRPSTAVRLLEKQKSAAAGVAAEKQRLQEKADSKHVNLAEITTTQDKLTETNKMHDQLAETQKTQDKLAQAHKAQAAEAAERHKLMPFEFKYPSTVTWKLPRKRGLAMDQGLWDTPWRMVQGSDWRNPDSSSVDLTVFRHSIHGTVIELKHSQGSGRSIVFQPASAGDTPNNKPGNTLRRADKVKICRDDAYVADWRFNAAILVKRMEAGEGTKIPNGPISFGCWNFEQTDPSVVCEEVFHKLDADGSGTMEANEVFEAAQMMGFTDMSEENFKAWIKGHDQDGNGLIDQEEFKALIGINDAARNMKVTTSDSTSELWLTCEGFVMLAHDNKNESIICIGGNLLPYSVPKNAAWVHLGRADEALKRTEFAAKEAAKKNAVLEAKKLTELAEVMAKLKKDNEKQIKAERRRLREAAANGNPATLIAPS